MTKNKITLIYFLLPILAHAEFSIESLRNLTNSGTRTIEALLPQLPVELLQEFTYMREGDGRQESSPRAPRAILFGRDARFIATFNGHASLAGYNQMEVAEWHDGPPPELRLYEVTFPEKGSKRGVSISDPNPQRCTRCHGNPPQYIWGPTYGRGWTGAFGATNDQIDPQSQEGRDYALFRRSRNLHPRYRNLKEPLNQVSALPPYEVLTARNDERDYQNMPNRRLTMLLTRRSALLQQSYFSNNRHYEKYLPLLSALVLQCREAPTVEQQRILFSALLVDTRENQSARAKLFDVNGNPIRWDWEEVTQGLMHLFGTSVGHLTLDPPREHMRDRLTTAVNPANRWLNYVEDNAPLGNFIAWRMWPAVTAAARQRGVTLPNFPEASLRTKAATSKHGDFRNRYINPTDALGNWLDESAMGNENKRLLCQGLFETAARQTQAVSVIQPATRNHETGSSH